MLRGRSRYRHPHRTTLNRPGHPRSRCVVPTVGICLLIATGTAACATTVHPDDVGGAVISSHVDGDTVVVNIHGTSERVRLLGIDTAELRGDDGRPECGALDAAAATAELLPVGTVVTLARDIVPRDHYGRLLAHIFRTGDISSVNEALLRRRLARQLVIEPNTALAEEYHEAEREARAAQCGIWGDCARTSRR